MEHVKFLPVASSADVPEGEAVRATVAGQEIALYKLGGRIFATQGLCTHGQAYLADGYVEGDMIECPMHSGQFDIRTGKATKPPCVVDLRTFPVKVEDGQVFVAVSAQPIEPRDSTRKE